MLNPRLTECAECTSIQALLYDIDRKIFKLSSDLYNNTVYMLNRSIDASAIFDLLNYKRILTYKYYNSEYANDFTLANIAGKVKSLTIGSKKDCMCEDNTTYTLTTTTTSSTSSTTTTTTTTVEPTTTTTTTVTPTTTTTTTTAPLTLAYYVTEDGCPPYTIINLVSYHNGVGALPSNGNSVWTNIGGTIPIPNGIYAFATTSGGTTIGVIGTLTGGIFTTYNPGCE